MKNFITLLFTTIVSLQALAGGPLEIGEKAPDFKLKNVTGETVSLADYEKVDGYIVVFTCNTCPYSVMYEDRLIELHKKYEPMGWPVVAINPNDPEVRAGDSFEKMQERAKEKGFEFANLFDDGQKVYPKWGATRTPHFYVLNSDRVVEYIGAMDHNHKKAENVTETYLENAISKLEKGEKPDPNFTKAVGCTIKCKK